MDSQTEKELLASARKIELILKQVAEQITDSEMNELIAIYEAERTA